MKKSELRQIIREHILTEKLDMDVLNGSDTFLYQLLGRMQSDCEYFLGNDGQSRHIKHLWGGKDHIKYMYAIWDKLKTKPQWLSRKEIKKYDKEMKL